MRLPNESPAHPPPPPPIKNVPSLTEKKKNMWEAEYVKLDLYQVESDFHVKEIKDSTHDVID